MSKRFHLANQNLVSGLLSELSFQLSFSRSFFFRFSINEMLTSSLSAFFNVSKSISFLAKSVGCLVKGLLIFLPAFAFYVGVIVSLEFYLLYYLHLNSHLHCFLEHLD